MLVLGFTLGAAGIAEYSFQAFFRIFSGSATAIVIVICNLAFAHLLHLFAWVYWFYLGGLGEWEKREK